MNKPKYWRGMDELEQSPEFLANARDEFPTDVPLEEALESGEVSLGFNTDRRNFMKIMGFGVTAATLAACVETPIKKAIPYVQKPDDIIPGVSNWYASTSCTGVPVLVKTREGRPIKLEGNPDSPLSRGALDAVGHASLLNLYDTERFSGPMRGKDAMDWATLDAEVKQKLTEIQAAGGKIRLLSGSVLSPSTQAVIREFLAAYPNAQHIAYDAVSASAIARAHEINFGKKATPSYAFDKADVIVSFSCDFLGTWQNPSAHMAAYGLNRDPDKGRMSRHFQFESLLSMTGANADLRFPINPSQEGLALLNLYNKVAALLGRPAIPGVPAYEVAMNGIEAAAKELAAHAGASLVVCGTNDIASQQIVNALNSILGNYGKTLDLDNPAFYKQGDDAALAALAAELSSVDAIIFYDANPVYDSPYGAAFAAALPGMKLSVSLAIKSDETGKLCQYAAPDSHYLESWSDARQEGGHYSLVQPAINPIFNTRQAPDSLMAWAGIEGSYYDKLRNFWQGAMMPQQSKYTDFQTFWDNTLRSGVMTVPQAAYTSALFSGELVAVAKTLLARYDEVNGGYELALYEKVAIRDGKYANNPWLQELPDPITRATWDNYLVVPVRYAKEKGLKQEDVVKVTVGDKSVSLAVFIQPGQAQNTLGIALGYGRSAGGKVTATIKGSADAYPMVSYRNDSRQYSVAGVEVNKTGETYPISCVQEFHTLFDPAKKAQFGEYYDRTEAIISETNFEAYKADPKAVNKHRNEKKAHMVTLWKSHYEDKAANRYIRWAMAIDMNKCTGCGACVVSCNAENNIPVVGKKEIGLRRGMHWMRIDRYYSGSPENPDVVFQPMLCQHCANAPCETVCPVLATIHSHEGLNQMAYNRCVGTRYCANNCPYKVRRFNWFNYYNGSQFKDINPTQTDLGRLVLNPDVTVRFRGVMEKCSFCVQRLQDAKLKAKVETGTSLNPDGSAVKPKDGDIKTACQQSCPTGAIVFGDLNDPESAISKLWKANRAYHVIEEVKTYPSIAYMSRVKNRSNAEVQAIEDVTHKVMEENAWLEAMVS